MVHLSSGRSEVIRKLLQMTRGPSDEILALYTNVNHNIMKDPPGNFADALCDLISVGEMENIVRLIQKSRYYNSQDKLVEDVLYHLNSVS